MRLSGSLSVKYANVCADFYSRVFPKRFGGHQVTWDELVSIVLFQYLLFCLCYVRLVWPVSIVAVSAVSLYLVGSGQRVYCAHVSAVP